MVAASKSSEPAAVSLAAGLMQPWPLTINRIIDHAARWHGSRELVSRAADGSIERSDWARVRERARRFSNALLAAGVRRGDRIATLAMNSARHVEAWYGTMGIGAVCHTINPRLFEEQLVYIVNHAEDRWILADPMFAPLLEKLRPRCPSIERVVYFGPDYEALIGAQGAECRWGDFEENTAAGLCYTSGTTGNPKGVLYSHRGNFLHTLITLQADAMGLSAADTVLQVVPMFHANAWGIPFSAAAAGAKLVLPGPRLDGASVYELLESEAVTFSAAVPTVWQGLLDHLDSRSLRLSTLKRVLIGGSACPEALLRAFQERYAVKVIHAWGMTEMSPLGTVAALTGEIAAATPQVQLEFALKQGRAPCGVDMKITDDEGRALAHDGQRSGNLKVSGPAVIRRYFREAEREILDSEGYFDTGDIASIDPQGYMRITDRAKDLIKSGGEWISSVDIENAAAGHPKAQLAAVIGMPHPKWRERPLLIVKLKAGQQATPQEFLDYLGDKVAKWWLPDEVKFVDEIPLGATGKIDKKRLREIFAPARG